MTNELKFNMSRRSLIAGGAALSAAAIWGCQPSKTKPFDAEFIILGAGLSGLHAARLLEAEGKDVLVLEGSSRIGGRMHTLAHSEGNLTEGGGEQIGASYARIIDTAHTLDVALTPDSAMPTGTTYSFQGKTYDAEGWKNMPNHPFAPPFKGSPPSSPFFGLAARENPLSAAMDWRDPKFSAYDISATDFLRNKGLSDQSLAVIDHSLNGNSLDSYSMMNLYRTLQLYSQSRDMGPSLSVDGGAQRLPEAMANSLNRPVKMGHIIRRIEVTDDSGILSDSSGQTFRASNVICALPFGALRHIELTAPLSAPQKTAIAELPYTQILQLHFKVDSPFWEVDGLAANMWMDGPLERIFFSHDSSQKPTGYGRAWINGTGAAMLASMNDVELDELLKAQLSAIRPVKPSDIKLLAVQKWTTGNTLAGGAYMHWAPGQIADWAETMAQPAGRLSFAGEHLSYLHTGMEGAMESGENAAFSLLNV